MLNNFEEILKLYKVENETLNFLSLTIVKSEVKSTKFLNTLKGGQIEESESIVQLMVVELIIKQIS